jgi:hypothetical protein
VILRELSTRKFPIEDWKIHNAEGIVQSKFFRENVLKHCTDTDMSGACVGRQRCVNWARDENCVAMVHIRFHRIRPVLLDLAWAGIPVVHNSPSFKDIGNGAERLYYEDNSVSGGAGAFQNLLADLKDGVGWFKPEKQKENKDKADAKRLSQQSQNQSSTTPEAPPAPSEGMAPSEEELAATELALQADVETMHKLLEADDMLAEAYKIIEQQNLQLAQLELRFKGIMNEKNELVKLLEKTIGKDLVVKYLPNTENDPKCRKPIIDKANEKLNFIKEKMNLPIDEAIEKIKNFEE